MTRGLITIMALMYVYIICVFTEADEKSNPYSIIYLQVGSVRCPNGNHAVNFGFVVQPMDSARELIRGLKAH